jgi:hypothetical protein
MVPLSLRRLAHRLFRPTPPVRRPARPGTAGGRRPRLEALEDRTLPSTVNWIGGPGDWSNPNNWQDATTLGHHVPTAVDDAMIDVPGVTVTHSTGTDTVHSLVSQGPFVVSGGSLALTSTSTLNGTFTFSDGILSGLGNLTVNGALTWTGGTMRGPGRTLANGGLALSNPGGFVVPSTTLDGRAFDNAAAAVWTGRGNISVINGASFNNLGSATFDVQTDTVSSASFSGSGASNTFNNAGLFHKGSTSGTAFIGIAFNNSGAVDVQAGTLNLNGGGDSTGSFVVEAGATLGFNTGLHTLRATSSVSGDGTVQFGTSDFGGGGTVNELGTYSAAMTNLVSSTVNFAHDTTLPSLNMSGGTLTGLADIVVLGTMNWTGGTFSGAGSTTCFGLFTISGNTAKSIDTRTLTNAGNATWTGSDILVINGAAFNNQGNFDAQAAASLTPSFNTPGTFNNSGSFTKSQSTDPTSVTIPFNNSGTVEVLSGRLQLANGFSSGTYTVDAGTALSFGGNHTLSGSSTVQGDGDVRFTNGTNNVFGTFAPGGTVTVSGATVNFGNFADLMVLTFTGGTITGDGLVIAEQQLNWTGGTMSGAGATLSNGVLNLSNVLSFGGPALDARALYNAGLAVWTGTNSVSLANGAVLDNLLGATFLVEANATLGGGLATFINDGDLEKVLSSGTTTFNLTFNNTDGGTVEVQTGTLNLAGPGNSTGAMSVSGGAVLLFSGTSPGTTPYTLRASSSLSGDGTVQIGTQGGFVSNLTNVAGLYAVANTDVVSGTVNFASDATVDTLTLEGGTLTGTGNLSVTGTLNWLGGAMSGVGSTTSFGTFTLSGSVSKDLNGRALTNAGTATWTGSGSLTLRNGAVLDNQGTFLIQNDTPISGGGFLDTQGTLANEGTLRKQSGVGTTAISAFFSNSGTVEAQSGTLSFTGAYNQVAGTTLLSGGTLSATSATGGVNLLGGSLTGSGTINGNVTNSGVVSPGGDGVAGLLTINGTYTQTATGTLALKLGGTGATQYDRLHVSGAASLDGTLSVHLIAPFSPMLNDAFQVLTYASRTGDFATRDFPSLSGGLFLAENLGATVLTLETHS